MQTNIPSEIKKSLLNVSDTNAFAKDLDVSCRSIDFEKLKKTFYKFNLQNHPDTKDFLLQGKDIFGLFNNIDKGFEVVQVDTHATRCIACEFGKAVSAYTVNYKKLKDTVLPGRIIYINSFAINLDIKNGYLYEFAWCNQFLNKDEMKELAK